MHQLVYELRQLCQRNKDGSFQTQHDRRTMLLMCGTHLVEAGYRQLHAADLKGRHVHALLARWKADGVSDATTRNRLAALRWVFEKLGKRGVMPPTNARYHLEPRQFVARESKAQVLDEAKWAKIQDRFVQWSLVLQREFGLRRCESILFRVAEADQGHCIALRGSWTKGGRARTVPVLIESQRAALEGLKAFLPTPASAVIPSALSYIQQVKRYEDWTRRVGLSKLHGLRHLYAQRRFAELSGFPCPAAGGPSAKDLTPAQREADDDARSLLTEELGHCRISITRAYIG